MFYRIVLLSLLASGCATTPKNCGIFERATSEYRLCRADQDSKEYQFRVGMEKYVLGDYRSARQWLVRAASANTKSTKTNMMLDQGAGLADNLSHDRREVIEEGVEAAAYMLSIMYQDGIGVRTNEGRAARYQKQAGNWVVVVEETPQSYIIHVKSKMSPTSVSDEPLHLHELYAFKVLRND